MNNSTLNIKSEYYAHVIQPAPPNQWSCFIVRVLKYVRKTPAATPATFSAENCSVKLEATPNNKQIHFSDILHNISNSLQSLCMVGEN